MPPIPEDAVVIADYMLMADFVPNTSFGIDKISKGVRFVSSSRDHFYDSAAALTLYRESVLATGGFRVYNSAATKSNQLPFFGSGITQRYHSHSDRCDNTSFQIDGAAYGTSHAAYVAGDRIGTTSPNPWDTGNNDGTFSQVVTTNGVNAEEYTGVRNLTVGSHTLKVLDSTSGQYYIPTGSEIHSPIHTSSHYQTFETPFLHELVGGDRNMEQTNLVVTPDGKTWDEVTRDVSYMGSTTTAKVAITGGHPSGVVIWDEHRGSTTTGRRFECVSKNIVYGYDRLIILETGYYNIKLHGYANAATRGDFFIMHNSTSRTNQFYMSTGASGDETQYTEKNIFLKRGDFIAYYADSGPTWHGTQIGYTWTELTKLS
jgi:hypothetical protein